MITGTFLASLANYANGRITKVVLNDAIEITNFLVKEITESTIGMQFIVPVAEVSLVTKIDLKDNSDNVISTNNVNVPIASDTLLLQTLIIKEVS
ncbi:hypothetical protein D3C74_143610 [compost metagenome]